MYFLSQDQKAVGSGLVWLCRAQDIDEFESHSILLCSKMFKISKKHTSIYLVYYSAGKAAHAHFQKKRY